MEKTSQYSNGVRGILTRARRYNPEIGNHIEHFINERFSFTIRLSNGRIEMPMEMAQDLETMPSSITEDSIRNLSTRFQSKNPRHIVEQEPFLQPISKKATGFWQKLRKWLRLK